MNFNIGEAEILVKDFNEFIEAELNKFILNSSSFEGRVSDLMVDERMNDYILSWESKEISSLNNITPKEYIGSYSELDDLIDLFNYFGNNSIERVPNTIIDKIYSFGDEGLKKLFEGLNSDVIKKNILEFNALTPQDNQQINVVQSILKALQYLGEKADFLCDDMIRFMSECNSHNELFLELGGKTLGSMGMKALMRVVEHINNTDEILGNEEYMLLALCDIGYKNGNDEIYKCLKNSFIRMYNKLIGAVLLGDYGDGRAIPMLRKFAIDNKGFIDENTYFGVLGAIDKLGGEVKDLLPTSLA